MRDETVTFYVCNEGLSIIENNGEKMRVTLPIWTECIRIELRMFHSSVSVLCFLPKKSLPMRD
ncbi:hypothetical protein [Laceyella putida]|uniref:Uncharacterized protein n=1 Tax=Laceyella putida TaxID=110101 RepID=A0ABW2RPQ5_9BACL